MVVNPPSMRSDDPPPNISAAPRVFKLNLFINKPDPKVYLDEAWILLKPALTSILHEEDLDRFSFASINHVSSCCFRNNAGEALYKLIVEECGTYISTTLESLAVHCNDDDPYLLLLPLEKFWLEFGKKFRVICSIAGVEGRIYYFERKLWNLGFELFPSKLFLASQVRDKVQTSILLLITDQRLGKSVNVSLLENLILMLNGSVFRELLFLEKPFLDSTAEFYAAEAKQVLEQSSDLPHYLKYVHQRLGEEKKKCKSLPLFSTLEDELLEVVNRELLGVHACAILEKGFEKLMDGRHFDELSRMYDLFSQADLVGHINDALSSYICKTGEKILKEEGSSSLAELKARVDKICFSYFLEDPLLEMTAQKCFERLGMSVVPPMQPDCLFPEDMLEFAISVPVPTRREALSNLILEECGEYISTTLQCLAAHCNDDDPSLLLLLLEKSWLEFPKKLRFICSIAGVGGRKLWDLGLELLPTKLFLASQVRDKVRTVILLLITDQRLGKSVNMSQLENLTDMFNGDPFRELHFLEKPLLDSTAEFYAAEAKQVLEQSDLPQYLKHVEQRIGEEKKNHFSTFEDELLEAVNRELLGIHACAILEKADLVGHISDALSSYICKTGEKILKEEGSSLAEFKTHVYKIWFTYFSEDPLLEKTVQKFFEGLGMSVSPDVSPLLDPSAEELLELGKSSGPLPTSHWCF
ncbi:hypothetical protein Bca101_016464 [Brassica carinata]